MKVKQASVSAFGTMSVFLWQNAEGQCLCSAKVLRLSVAEALHAATQQALSINQFLPRPVSTLREGIQCLNFLNSLFTRKSLKSDHMIEKE
jgi:hypothetical protein